LCSLLSLFEDADQIEINYQNQNAFLFLANQLDNSFLETTCLNVAASSPQFFVFTSERFLNIPQKILSQLFNFTIYINHEAFFCNSAFASCLSHAIFELKNEDSAIQEIYFNVIPLHSILLEFFLLLKGYPFNFSSYEINDIQSAIDLIKFTSFKIDIPEPSKFDEAISFL
jgi:hypothetical protein